MADRFWQRIRRGPPGECWEWEGAVNNSGYGYVSVRGRVIGAHLRALELARGARLLPGLEVCHRCDNRRCCNPAHLSVGTRADNRRDMVTRGRAPRYQVPDLPDPPDPPDPLVGLSPDQLEAIRQGLRTGFRTPSGGRSYSLRGLARFLAVPRQAAEAVWWGMADDGVDKV